MFTCDDLAKEKGIQIYAHGMWGLNGKDFSIYLFIYLFIFFFENILIIQK